MWSALALSTMRPGLEVVALATTRAGLAQDLDRLVASPVLTRFDWIGMSNIAMFVYLLIKQSTKMDYFLSYRI